MGADSKYIYQIEFNTNGEAVFTQLNKGQDAFQGKAKNTQRATSEIGEGFRRLRETMVATFGVFEAFSFGKQSEEYYLGIQRGNAEIQASLKSTRGAAGETTEMLDQSADALFHHTEYNKENIKKMQSVLLTFPKITKETFNEAEQAIADTGAKLEGKSADLAGMALRIGKALQDPATGMMMLRREGVNFTRSQQTMVEQLVKSGHQMAAEKYILHELETEFGGSADAALEAGGAHEEMAKSMDDVKEITGKLVDEMEEDLLPVFNKGIGVFRSAIEWGEKHKNLIEGTIKIIGTGVIIFTAYTIITKAAILGTQLFTAAQALAAGYTAAETAEVTGLTVAMEALNAVADANPFVLIASLVAGLAGSYILFKNNSDLTDPINQVDTLGNSWKKAATEINNYNAANNKIPGTHKFADIQTGGDGKLKAGLDSFLHKQELEKYNDYTSEFEAKNFYYDKSGKLVPYKKGFKGTPLTFNKWEATQNEATPSGNTKSNTSGIPGSSGSGSVSSTEDIKGEHQITNTWNIREFGKTDIHVAAIEKGLEQLGDKIMTLLMQSINNSQIASGQ